MLIPRFWALEDWTSRAPTSVLIPHSLTYLGSVFSNRNVTNMEAKVTRMQPSVYYSCEGPNSHGECIPATDYATQYHYSNIL